MKWPLVLALTSMSPNAGDYSRPRLAFVFEACRNSHFIVIQRHLARYEADSVVMIVTNPDYRSLCLDKSSLLSLLRYLQILASTPG